MLLFINIITTLYYTVPEILRFRNNNPNSSFPPQNRSKYCKNKHFFIFAISQNPNANLFPIGFLFREIHLCSILGYTGFLKLGNTNAANRGASDFKAI